MQIATARSAASPGVGERVDAPGQVAAEEAQPVDERGGVGEHLLDRLERGERAAERLRERACSRASRSASSAMPGEIAGRAGGPGVHAPARLGAGHARGAPASTRATPSASVYGSGVRRLGPRDLEPACARLHQQPAVLGVARQLPVRRAPAEQAVDGRERGEAAAERGGRGGDEGQQAIGVAELVPACLAKGSLESGVGVATRRRRAATDPARRAAPPRLRRCPRTDGPPRSWRLEHRAHAAHPRPCRAITRRWISAAPPATVLPALARVSAATRPSPPARRRFPPARAARAGARPARPCGGPASRSRASPSRLRPPRAGPRRAARPHAARAAAPPGPRRAAGAARAARRPRRPRPSRSSSSAQHHADLLARHALVVERAHQHPPAAVQLADELRARDLDVRQEDLAQHAAADGLDLAHLDPGERMSATSTDTPRCGREASGSVRTAR